MATSSPVGTNKYKPAGKSGVKILQSVQKTRCVVTAENHTIINGLGAAVAECLVENLPVPMKRVGVRDHFGEVGFTEPLKEKYGLKAANIAQAARDVLKRKH